MFIELNSLLLTRFSELWCHLQIYYQSQTFNLSHQKFSATTIFIIYIGMEFFLNFQLFWIVIYLSLPMCHGPCWFQTDYCDWVNKHQESFIEGFNIIVIIMLVGLGFVYHAIIFNKARLLPLGFRCCSVAPACSLWREENLTNGHYPQESSLPEGFVEVICENNVFFFSHCISQMACFSPLKIGRQFFCVY